MNEGFEVLKGLNAILSMMPILIFIGFLASAFKRKRTPKNTGLWIESPHHKFYNLPFYQALRVIRKREGWQLAEVEPKKPAMTRWQHLKAALGIKVF